MVSYQVGAVVAKGLFAALGPAGAVSLRGALAAVVLPLLWRPRFAGHAPAGYAAALLFGLSLAGMNLAFFAALERIPLGVAVAVGFVGPLGVAVAGSRRLLDLAWAALAAVGIALLAPWGGDRLDPVGLGLAAVTGGFWAAYILLAACAGRLVGDGTGLALAMCVAAIVLAPLGVSGGAVLLDPTLVATGLAVALLSSVLPFSLEYEALWRMPARPFAMLVALNPAIAALVGFVLLGEGLGFRSLAAILLVTTAAVGAARFGTEGADA
jgi:inner membrane transporter RhtA